MFCKICSSLREIVIVSIELYCIDDKKPRQMIYESTYVLLSLASFTQYCKVDLLFFPFSSPSSLSVCLSLSLTVCLSLSPFVSLSPFLPLPSLSLSYLSLSFSLALFLTFSLSISLSPSLSLSPGSLISHGMTEGQYALWLKQKAIMVIKYI